METCLPISSSCKAEITILSSHPHVPNIVQFIVNIYYYQLCSSNTWAAAHHYMYSYYAMLPSNGERRRGEINDPFDIQLLVSHPIPSSSSI